MNFVLNWISREINDARTLFNTHQFHEGDKWLEELGNFNFTKAPAPSLLEMATKFQLKMHGLQTRLKYNLELHDNGKELSKKYRSRQYFSYLAHYKFIKKKYMGNFLNRHLNILCTALRKDHGNDDLDSLAIYLFGLILIDLNRKEEAVSILLEAVKRCPLNWPAWEALSTQIHTKESYLEIPLIDHWMKLFFQAHMEQKLKNPSASNKIYSELQKIFIDSTYLARILNKKEASS